MTDQLRALLDKIDGKASQRWVDGEERYTLELTRQERNCLADTISDALERKLGSL